MKSSSAAGTADSASSLYPASTSTPLIHGISISEGRRQSMDVY